MNFAIIISIYEKRFQTYFKQQRMKLTKNFKNLIQTHFYTKVCIMGFEILLLISDLAK